MSVSYSTRSLYEWAVNAQSDLGIRCPHMPQNTFSQSAAQMFLPWIVIGFCMIVSCLLTLVVFMTLGLLRFLPAGLFCTGTLEAAFADVFVDLEISDFFADFRWKALDVALASSASSAISFAFVVVLQAVVVGLTVVLV